MCRNEGSVCEKEMTQDGWTMLAILLPAYVIPFVFEYRNHIEGTKKLVMSSTICLLFFEQLSEDPLHVCFLTSGSLGALCSEKFNTFILLELVEAV